MGWLRTGCCVGLLFFTSVVPAQEPTRNWPRLGGTPGRTSVAVAHRLPEAWDVESGHNIRWSVPIPDHWGTPVVADGQLFIGTNNRLGYLPRYPAHDQPNGVDLGCLICLETATGNFLWQYSCPKHPAGRVHDWPMFGICSTPTIEGDRLYFVNNRGEVVCLDTRGFLDDQDDRTGGFWESLWVRSDDWRLTGQDADLVWSFDMLRELGVYPLSISCNGPAIWGDVLFVCTGNGAGQSRVNIPAPEAPSFIALDRHTGRLLWQDNSPGENILDGQWCSPTAGMLGGVPQVVFGGGDGWVYSFRADEWKDGKPILLWKFDCNPKDAEWTFGNRSLRNGVIAHPVFHHDRVYVVVGQNPEHGDGPGCLWCIDPTKRGDVSPTLVVNAAGNVVPPRRLRAVHPEAGEQVIPNPNAAAVWSYAAHDARGDGVIDFDEQMHRTIAAPAIKGDLLVQSDLAGFLHCLDANTGVHHWRCDLQARCWCAPLIAGDVVYQGDENGHVTILPLTQHPREALTLNRRAVHEPSRQIVMPDTVETSPCVVDNVLYLATRKRLYAIEQDARSQPGR